MQTVHLSQEVINVDGKNVVPDVHSVLDAIKAMGKICSSDPAASHNLFGIILCIHHLLVIIILHVYKSIIYMNVYIIIQ